MVYVMCSFKVWIRFKRMIMRKIIVSIFLVLNFLYSCRKGAKRVLDWFNKAKALNYTDQKKAIEYLNNAIKLNPSYGRCLQRSGNCLHSARSYHTCHRGVYMKPSSEAGQCQCLQQQGASYLKQGNKNFGMSWFAKSLCIEKMRVVRKLLKARDSVVDLMGGSKTWLQW